MQFRVKELRVARGWTQAELAERANISVPYVSQIETGKHKKVPSLDVLERMANALDVHVTELFTPPAMGFAESAVDPWEPPASEAKALRKAGGITHFRVRGSGAVGLGYQPGSIVVVDLNQTPQENDTVIATLYDDDSASSVTIIGRIFRGALLGGRFLADPTDQTELSRPGVTVRGVVVSAVRNLQPGNAN